MSAGLPIQTEGQVFPESTAMCSMGTQTEDMLCTDETSPIIPPLLRSNRIFFIITNAHAGECFTDFTECDNIALLLLYNPSPASIASFSYFL